MRTNIMPTNDGVRDAGPCSEEDGSLESILDTAFEEYHARQHRDELRAIAHLVSDTEPETVLEIGTAEGGSLYTWARHFASAERIVSVDVDHTPETMGRCEAFDSFTDIHCIEGLSQDETVVEKVESRVRAAGIDFLFIDGGSSESEVRDDYRNFAPLVNDGGIVAFHDIRTEEDENDPDQPDDCRVNEVWNEVKSDYPHVELVADPQQTEYGYGVLFV